MLNICDNSKAAYLINIFIVTFHALNGNVFACLNALSLEDLAEGSFTFLANQTIFYISFF